MNKLPICRYDNIVLQEFAEEVLIYDLETNKAFCLNQTSAMVWHECNGNQSVAEISQSLTRKLKSNVTEEIVWLAISQFKSDGLLKNDNNFNTPFDGLSRREVIKKIGFASIVSLPMIASVTAPSAIQAQSDGACDCFSAAPNSHPPGCFCSTDSECCSGVCFLMTICQNLAPVGATCCPSSANCGVFPLAPGCLCLNNSDCASGLCDSVSMVCQI